jgi:hypothetical protein
MQQLHAVAFNEDHPIILTMPEVRGTPINEHSGHAIAIDAFPSLFQLAKQTSQVIKRLKLQWMNWYC